MVDFLWVVGPAQQDANDAIAVIDAGMGLPDAGAQTWYIPCQWYEKNMWWLEDGTRNGCSVQQAFDSGEWTTHDLTEDEEADVGTLEGLVDSEVAVKITWAQAEEWVFSEPPEGNPIDPVPAP